MEPIDAPTEIALPLELFLSHHGETIRLAWLYSNRGADHTTRFANIEDLVVDEALWTKALGTGLRVLSETCVWRSISCLSKSHLLASATIRKLSGFSEFPLICSESQGPWYDAVLSPESFVDVENRLMFFHQGRAFPLSVVLKNPKLVIRQPLVDKNADFSCTWSDMGEGVFVSRTIRESNSFIQRCVEEILEAASRRDLYNEQ